MHISTIDKHGATYWHNYTPNLTRTETCNQ